ncbi:hypothetical protein [Sporisorium scitamineum]|uniref:Uncharacterized protein n=1 Tax=Sporisorium scitamineum TaxID=49012 RepID=A0A0F7S5I4_9BASI|nr:hypothetical protein [Sporisorium scitamineum]
MSINLVDSIRYFSGSANGINGTRSQPSPKHFVKAFKCYLIHPGKRDDGDTVSSKEACLDKYATHLKLMIKLLQKENNWDDWLQHLWELGSDVPNSYMADTTKVYMAWCSLPHEIQTVIKQPQDATLSEFVNTCHAVPWSTYEQVLADHDQKLMIEKQLCTLQQHDSKDHKMCNNLAGIHQFMDSMVSTQLLLTPPKDTSWFLPALEQYVQPVTQQAHLPLLPP